MSTEHNPEPPAGYILDDSVDHLPEGTMVLSRYCEDDDWGFANYAGKDIPPEYHQNWWVAIPIITITPDAGKAEAPAQQPAEAEADIIDHDWQLLSGARVQCAKCGHLTRASDLAMLSSACTGKAQPASEGQQPAEAMPETEDSELSRLREENKKLHKQSAHMMRRVYSNEDTELDCPFCESYPATGSPQEVPMCPLCQVESSLGDLRAQLTTERAAREQAEKRAEYVQGLQAEITKAFPSARLASSLKVAIAFAAQEKDAAERERDSLAARLAESESREHQLREVLKDADQCIDRLSRTIANKGQRDDEETRWARNREACETGDRITAALATPTSTTVADLRKRAETAERERDAVVEDKERLDWIEVQAKASPTGISFDWCRYAEEGQVVEHGFRFMRRHFLGERKKDIRAAIDAALATTQETK